VKVLLGAWPWRARQETDRSRSRPTCSRAAWRGCARCGPPIASHRCAGATTGTSATTFSATAFRSPRRWKRIGSAWFARNAEFGLLIGERNRHGKGLAKEALALVAGYAFETLNLHKLYLRVVAFNKRALVLYRAFGFVEEGVQRQQAFLRGRYYDVVLMGLIRSPGRHPT
jgi:hypothetical protein